MNIVIVQGSLSSAPVVRTLPSGDRLVTYEVTVRDPRAPTESVPVVWFDPPDRAEGFSVGAAVTVAGRVRRRFFRSPAGTRSRTEVVADVVWPSSQRKRAARAVASAVARASDESA